MTIYRYVDGELMSFVLTNDEMITAYEIKQREEDSDYILYGLGDIFSEDEEYKRMFENLEKDPYLLRHVANKYREYINCTSADYDLELLVDAYQNVFMDGCAS